ncbi:hypothetical protein Goarm_010008 [Gossypium armourianum]|uniref:Uncharacterized protein n=1 Tax=Gossypium armourianum TaxID=34283 RepID=A0A7J9JUM9_9ROSI|nr:hypothetical protein [Gossypium armourianum]
MDCTLKDLVTSDAIWNLDLFRIWFPDEVINHIVSIPPYLDSGSDKTTVRRFIYTRMAQLQEVREMFLLETLNDIELEDSSITLIRRLRRIMRIEGQWQIRYMPREHIIVVGRLAKLSLTLKLSLQVFDVASIVILEVLQQDKASGAFRQLS